MKALKALAGPLEFLGNFLALSALFAASYFAAQLADAPGLGTYESLWYFGLAILLGAAFVRLCRIPLLQIRIVDREALEEVKKGLEQVIATAPVPRKEKGESK